MKRYFHEENCGGEVNRNTLICDKCKTRPRGSRVFMTKRPPWNPHTANRRMERMFEGRDVFNRTFPKSFPRD